MRDIYFYDNGNMVIYRSVYIKEGILTNIVQVSSTSKNIKINHLINELNELYNQIKNITPIL